jgi:hypothetical protein
METITPPARVRPLDGSDVADGLIGHEARHASVAALLEFDVASVRADWPEPTIAGRVSFDHSSEVWDDLRLAQFFIVAAAGPMGDKGWPPAWPPSLSNPGSDEYSLARICQLLNLDERRYRALTAVARKTVEHPAVRRAESALSTLLEHTSLAGREVRTVAEIAFGGHFKEVREAQQREAQELEAPPEQPPQHAEDEAPQEREALHPRHQATLEQSLANLRAAMRHNTDRASGAKALRITAGFWRGVV